MTRPVGTDNPAAEYVNSFHNPWDASCGPVTFKTEVRPVHYRGYDVYHRLANCWDIVEPGGDTDGLCIGMYAGLSGAKRRIDALLLARKEDGQ